VSQQVGLKAVASSTGRHKWKKVHNVLLAPLIGDAPGSIEQFGGKQICSLHGFYFQTVAPFSKSFFPTGRSF